MSKKWIWIGIIVVVIAGLGFLGYRFLMSPAGGDEILLKATSVGVANGPAANMQIGPAGGSLSSPDGRMTVTIPPNAVSAPIALVIQPITNPLERGLGNAYDLEPNGTTFATPVELSLHYDDHDLEGTVPEDLRAAYQDAKGFWHLLKRGRVDQEKKTVTVSTTHFTGYSFVPGDQLVPGEATIRVRKSVGINYVACSGQTWDQKLFGEPASCQDLNWSSEKGSSVQYRDWTVNGVPWGNSTVGTLRKSRNGVIYTAPDRKPKPNVVTVSLPIEVTLGEPPRPLTRTITYDSKITIEAAGYRASGSNGSVTYSGLVCSLDDPFVIDGKYPDGEIVGFAFEPKQSMDLGLESGGTVSFGGELVSFISVGGHGTFIIRALDTDAPVIEVQVESTATLPGIPFVKGETKSSGSGEARIQLNVDQTDECNKSTKKPAAPTIIRHPK